jgi:hypothetical protein
MSDERQSRRLDRAGRAPSGMSRRAVLSGLGAVGITGALGGWATYATLADRESVDGFLQTGTVDLEVCWEDAGEDCTPTSNNALDLPISVSAVGDSGSTTIRAHIAETTDATANPGNLWLRTSCPVDGCGLEAAVDAWVWYDDNCDGVFDDDEQLIERGSLGDVLRWLHDGVQIDGNRDDSDPDAGGLQPIEPGQQVCLGVGWELREPLCEPDELTVEFELRAEQARHSMDPESPWAGLSCIVPDEDCLTCLNLGGISFLAFCGTDLAEGDVTLETVAVNDQGETVGVRWSSTADIRRVVMKVGNGQLVDGRGRDNRGPPTGTDFAMFEFDGGTGGTVYSPVGPDAYSTDAQLVVDGEPWSACPNHGGLKYEYVEDRWVVMEPR